MCGRYYSLFDKQAIAERFHNPAVGNWRNNGPDMLNGA
jgi:hypothetical protein